MQALAHEPISRKAGMTAFKRLAERWNLPRKTWPAILKRAPNTINNWISDAATDRESKLDADVQERIAYLVSIYDGLHRLFGDQHHADEWLWQKNRAFGGQEPGTRILSGAFADLYELHTYVNRALYG
ncbi:MAG: MbcA/ParS/Xre antitoxin family protein [Candidatus Eremiobacteraeota bacterium]|nr:MbcA/ParS/Xre antitoxin family protein [Candidatus Eremiobacteraeota bacterium]